MIIEKERLTGWKGWTLGLMATGEGFKARLFSYYGDDIWEPGIANEAKCLNFQIHPDRDDHTPPGPDCWCGIYAAVSLSEYAVREAPIIGEVALAGEVIEGERGYRARYAYPVSLRHIRCNCCERAFSLDDIRAGALAITNNAGRKGPMAYESHSGPPYCWPCAHHHRFSSGLYRRVSELARRMGRKKIKREDYRWKESVRAQYLRDYFVPRRRPSRRHIEESLVFSSAVENLLEEYSLDLEPFTTRELRELRPPRLLHFQRKYEPKKLPGQRMSSCNCVNAYIKAGLIESPVGGPL